MKKTTFYQKYIAPFIACCLACVLCIEIAPQIFENQASAEEKITYVSEVKLFQAEDLSKALSACEKEGYTPLRDNLNPGTDEDAVVLGYKTTEDREDAITDLSILQMGNGYQSSTYGEILRTQTDRFALLAEEMYTILPEFRQNYDKGSPAAQIARQLLNYYYVDDVSMELGDYLLSEKCDPKSSQFNESLLPDLLQRTSAGLYNAIFSALIPAVADYNPDTAFVPGKYTVEVDVTPEVEGGLDVIDAVLNSDLDTPAPATEVISDTTEENESEEPSDNEETSEESEQSTEETEETEEETEPTEPDVTEAPTENVPEDPEFNQASTESGGIDAEGDSITKKTFVLNCDMNYGNWALRVSKTGMVDLYKNNAITAKEQAVYNSAARDLKTVVQEFAANYQNAAARRAARGEAAIMPEISSDNRIDAALHVIDTHIEGEGKDSDADAYYLCIYDLLAQYPYDENTSLAEYLVQAGCTAYTDETESLYPLYPLAAALTSGQVHLMQVNGVAPMAMYLNNTDELWKTANETFQDIENDLKQFTDNTKHLSVWYGVDRSQYDQIFAITSQTIMKNQSGFQLKTYNSPRGIQKAYQSFCEKFQLASTIIGAIGATMTLVSSIGVAAGIWATQISVSACAAYAVSGGVLHFIIGGLGTIITAFGAISLYITIGMLLVQVGLAVYKTYFYEEDYLEAEFKSSIPGMVADINNKNEYVFYNAAKGYGVNSDVLQTLESVSEEKANYYKNNPDAEVKRNGSDYTVKLSNKTYGDLNACEGKDDRWLAVYWTKAENVGSPLRLDKDGNCFKLTNSTSIPSGYEAVNNFNEEVPANLNSYVDESNAPSIYLYYRTEYSIENEISIGNDQIMTEQQYLSELKIYNGIDEETVAMQMQQEGFMQIPGDLTKKSEFASGFTFLGYKSSNAMTDAITDIRVLPKDAEKPEALKNYTLIGQTDAGDSIYTSTNINCGQPILAEFNAIGSYGNRKLSYRAISTFDAYPYDFRNTMPVDPEAESAGMNADCDALIMTYRQAQQYLSGLTVRTGSSREAAVQELIDSGYELINRNLTPDSEKFTYVGYKWSSKADGCITDIRILPKGKDLTSVRNSTWYRSAGATANGDALYYSTNDKAGAAILADFGVLGDYAELQADSEKVFSTFDKLPFDFAASADFDPETLYEAVDVDQLAKDSEAAQQAAGDSEENQPEEAQPEKEQLLISYTLTRKPQYVTEVSVAQFYGNESGGKQALIEAGYNVLNVNLTPGVFRTYTYFGYKTKSTESNSSLCDIRIGTCMTDPSVVFGSGSYGLCAGQNQKLGRLSQGDGLYATASHTNGDPILADFVIVSDPKKAPLGYEPIMTFGGIPYNFDRCDTEDGTMTAIGNEIYAQDGLYDRYREKNPPVYIYYRPSVAYPSVNADGSPATRYISGITTVIGNSGDHSGAYIADALAYHIGSEDTLHKFGTGVDDDLMKGTDYDVHDEDIPETNFIYNYTYNPKRAVTYFKSYTANPGADAVPVNLVSAGNGYVTEDVILVLRTYFGVHHVFQQFLGYSPTHDFTSLHKLTFEYYEDDRTDDALPEDFETAGFWESPYSKADYTVSWETSPIRAKALYACGPTADAEPLREDDILVSNFSQKRLEDGREDTSWTSVEDFRTPNATTAHNLAYNSKLVKNPHGVYIYMHREQPQEKQYIKSVTLAVSDVKENVSSMDSEQDHFDDIVKSYMAANYNSCISSLLASCTDEILPRNLTAGGAGRYTFNEKRILMVNYVKSASLRDDLDAYYEAVEKYGNTYNSSFVVSGRENIAENIRINAEDTLKEFYEMDVEQRSEALRLFGIDYQDHPVYNELYADQMNASYLGVSRTDNPSEAVRGLLKYKPEKGYAPESIKVDGMTYTRCGKAPVKDALETYYLYQTTHISAGDPITSIYFDSIPYAENVVTVPTTTKEGNSGLDEQYAVFNNQSYTFLHCRTNESTGISYLSKIVVGTGSTYREAACDLLTQGGSYIVKMDINAGDSVTLLGYKKTYSTKYEAVQDILLISGKQPTLNKSGAAKINKQVYYVLKHNNEPFCLNENDNTYLYYRTKASSAKELPFTKIGLGERDRVPDNTSLTQPWENILTFSKEHYNLNNGRVVADSDDSKLLYDNRLYLFGLRAAGNQVYVKPGAEITGGHCVEMQQVGDMMIQSN